MRHDPVDIRRDKVCGFQCFVHDAREIGNGVPEHLASLHPQFAHGAGGGRPAIDIEKFIMLSIGVQACGKRAACSDLCTEHDGTCTIAEQYAGSAILPVKDTAEGFRADHQRVFG